MLAELGFIGTIGEDDEVPVEPESDSGDDQEEVGAGSRERRGKEWWAERAAGPRPPQRAEVPRAGRVTQAGQSRPPQAESVLLPVRSGTPRSLLSVKSPGR